MAAPGIVAHRGASHDAPENTHAAFRLAWEQGADAIECDVWVTADARLVCLHDRSTGRTAGEPLDVTRTPLAGLRRLDAGAWKGSAWAGERIPTLAEVLDEVPEGKRIVVEIKDTARAVPILATLLESRAFPPGRVTVMSFDASVVAEATTALPGAEPLLLASPKRDPATLAWRPSRLEMLAGLQQANATGLDVKAVEIVDAGFISQVREAGFDVHVWTVNDVETAARFCDLGVATITTDRPGLLRALLVSIARSSPL